jgi:hypothetical protein
MADLTLFRARHPNKSHYSLVSSTQGLDSYRKETKEALRDPKQQCRLCHLSSASASAAAAAAGHDRKNRLLIVPCRCPQALHVQCLNELRNTSEEAKLTCLDCGFEYLFHPETRLSAWDHTRFISKVCFDISVAMAILQSVILSLMMLLMYLFSRGVDVFAMFSTLYDTDSDVVEARLIEEVRQSMVNINFNVNTTSSSSASSMNNMLDARMDGLEDLVTPTFW